MNIVFNAKSSQNKTNPTKEEIKPVLDLNGLNIAGVKTPWDSYASISGTFTTHLKTLRNKFDSLNSYKYKDMSQWVELCGAQGPESEEDSESKTRYKTNDHKIAW